MSRILFYKRLIHIALRLLPSAFFLNASPSHMCANRFTCSNFRTCL